MEITCRSLKRKICARNSKKNLCKGLLLLFFLFRNKRKAPVLVSWGPTLRPPPYKYPPHLVHTHGQVPPDITTENYVFETASICVQTIPAGSCCCWDRQWCQSHIYKWYCGSVSERMAAGKSVSSPFETRIHAIIAAHGDFEKKKLSLFW